MHHNCIWDARTHLVHRVASSSQTEAARGKVAHITGSIHLAPLAAIWLWRCPPPCAAAIPAAIGSRRAACPPLDRSMIRSHLHAAPTAIRSGSATWQQQRLYTVYISQIKDPPRCCGPCVNSRCGPDPSLLLHATPLLLETAVRPAALTTCVVTEQNLRYCYYPPTAAAIRPAAASGWSSGAGSERVRCHSLRLCRALLRLLRWHCIAAGI
jgi:hypothetical protein